MISDKRLRERVLDISAGAAWCWDPDYDYYGPDYLPDDQSSLLRVMKGVNARFGVDLGSIIDLNDPGRVAYYGALDSFLALIRLALYLKKEVA